MNVLTRQIALSDDLYDQLNDMRRHKGQKHSFNTVIEALIREALVHANDVELFGKLQWHAIQSMLKQAEDQGWLPHYTLAMSHVNRLMFDGRFKEAAEVLLEQLPAAWKPSIGTGKR